MFDYQAMILAAVASVALVAASMLPLATRSRIFSLVAANIAVSVNFLLQINHTLKDVQNDNVACILDTQELFWQLSVALFAIVSIASIFSLVMIARKISPEKRD